MPDSAEESQKSHRSQIRPHGVGDLCAGKPGQDLEWLIHLLTDWRKQVMAHRSIGEERLGFSASAKAASSLDELLDLIDWAEVATTLRDVYASAKGEAAWPPLSMFKAMLLSVWY